MVGYVITSWIRRAVGAVMESRLGQILPDRPSFKVAWCDCALGYQPQQLIGNPVYRLIGKYYEEREVLVTS